MRWERQRVVGGELVEVPVLPGLPGLVRSVRTPEFHDVTFHEVAAKSALNRVAAASAMPFQWTINPYRGCTHQCVYCYARRSHTYLDFDAGKDFDSQVIVKVNIGEVLTRELASSRWQREHVAMGTNTDPYQRAEGRYRLMPGVINALASSGTPFSILTKGTLLSRDLPLLAEAAQEVSVGLGVSIALVDRELQHSLEPGTPGPQARLDLVRRAREAGLPCGVFVAPVLPWLTDSTAALDALLAEIADAGATGVTVIPLHLRQGAREWFMTWLEREHPKLVPGYRRIYARGSYADRRYRKWLSEKVRPLLRKNGLLPKDTSPNANPVRGVDEEANWPDGSLPPESTRSAPLQPEQLSLLSL
ncbi:radical SAM protein [Longimycelium tulufanense]|uniref:Radical SAM protein n=1 Tax=Longimycelium tulufanense TaxID=907463 RepID=A0A8J3CII0_9PSEU|nr:Rv2578c family radical SAM protein [Longimycelium tulufanense]GGM72400.1 radical SAM protein [Longimycelium tulufanense]